MNNKRRLTNEEIDYVCDGLANLHPDNFVTENAKIVLRKQLIDVEIYPQLLEEFRYKIAETYANSIISPSEMVGCIASTSIGETTTQASLNSVVWDSKVLISVNGQMLSTTIGKFTDEKMNKDGFVKVEYGGKNDTDIKAYAEVLDVSKESIMIQSVNQEGIVNWTKISQLIRHPLYTKLIKVTTESLKQVTGTTGESFLLYKDGKIIPTCGSDLKVGDRLPITYNNKMFNEIKQINVRQWLNPKNYIYGTDLFKAKEIREDFLNGKLYIPEDFKCDRRISKWWAICHGTKFTLPYARTDIAVKSFNRLSDGSIKKDCVYLKVPSIGSSHLPENIDLDKNFGFFIGAYLAEGCHSKNFVSISNYDTTYLNRIEELMNIWNIKYHYTYIGYKYKIMNKYEEKNGRIVTDMAKSKEDSTEPCEIRIHSKLLADLVYIICGKGSLNKKLPDFVYNATTEFKIGLLDGLFSGDGSFKNNCFIYYSISKELVEGIQYLLSQFCIYSTISITKLKSNNKKSKILNDIYTVNIKNNNIEKFRNLVETLVIKHKNDVINNLIPNQLSNSYKVFRSKLTEKVGKSQDDYLNENQDVFGDIITSIDYVTTDYKFVYDFTVPETLNFQLQNGLNVRDSFHSSGQAKAALTSGVDRLKELLGASKEIKTPSLTIVFDIPLEQRKKLRKVRELAHQHIEYYKFSDLCESYEIERLEDIEYDEWYDFFDTFYNDSYKNCDIRIRTKINKEKLWKTRKNLEYIVYCLNGVINPDDELHFVFSPMEEFIIDIWCCSDNITSVDQILNPKIYSQEQRDALTTYIDSVSLGEFFLKYTVLPAILRTHISGLLDVERCYYSESKEHGWIIEDTKGGYMVDLWYCNIANLSLSRSNNMWEVYKLLGIEAVVKFLQEEFAKNISVSKRHLDVMIDWMTSTGSISSVSRYGVDIAKVGPLAKASFEQPLDAFFEAAHNAQKEIITGVSAAVATGNLANMGTGGFNLLYDLRMHEKIKEEMNIKDEVIDEEIVVSNVNQASIEEIEEFMEYEIDEDNGEQY